MSVGKVYLVGAGPGDPGLLTLKGLACLQQADIVLYDGLVNPLLLRHTSATAERTCRSSSRDGRILQQDEINSRLIAAARAGKTVVRLKGGDPFIFGRGGEEAAALAAAGIPFEVVPGITAATAAAEYAGISLTHREQASSVVFVTGHEDPAKGSRTAIDYRLLAKFGGTIVFYMGLHRLESIVDSLIEAGMSPDVPACVVSRATVPEQQTVAATLSTLPAAVRAANLRPPSLIVVGECVGQREQINWFEHRPLFGLRIGITRPEAQAGPQITRCLDLGAQPVLMPTVEILPPSEWQPVDDAISNLANWQWLVFTSANGVRSFFGRLWNGGGDCRQLGNIKIAAIGPATADALAECHVRADVVPDEYRAESLAAALAPLVAGHKVLWMRANRGRDVLPTELRAAGAAIDEVVAYQNIDIDELSPAVVEQIELGQLDWIALSSPSIARNLSRLLTGTAREQVGRTTKIATISPVTSETVRAVGLPVHAEAKVFTWDGLFDTIVAAQGTS